MSKSTDRKIFVNLAVRDLKRAKAFFSALGFDKAVELGPEAYLASQQK
jgi:predicted lactoylglutathione lyase